MNALTKPPYKLRYLDGLDKAFWLLDQHRNTHFSVIAEIEGFSRVEPWLTAVETIGKQSPFISAQISIDGDGAPFFEIGHPRAISQEQTVGVATLAGRLNLLHTSFEPAVDLLDVMIEILRTASGPPR
jgi:hypothetical protein